MIKTILKAILIAAAVILCPVIILLLIGVLAVAWPVVGGLLILSIPALIIGVLVGIKAKK